MYGWHKFFSSTHGQWVSGLGCRVAFTPVFTQGQKRPCRMYLTKSRFCGWLGARQRIRSSCFDHLSHFDPSLLQPGMDWLVDLRVGESGQAVESLLHAMLSRPAIKNSELHWSYRFLMFEACFVPWQGTYLGPSCSTSGMLPGRAAQWCGTRLLWFRSKWSEWFRWLAKQVCSWNRDTPKWTLGQARTDWWLLVGSASSSKTHSIKREFDGQRVLL